jgi:hypothetical protein
MVKESGFHLLYFLSGELKNQFGYMLTGYLITLKSNQHKTYRIMQSNQNEKDLNPDESMNGNG